MPSPLSPSPLSRVRVIEMGQLIAVPWATKMLADMGAQVIRLGVVSPAGELPYRRPVSE